MRRNEPKSPRIRRFLTPFEKGAFLGQKWGCGKSIAKIEKIHDVIHEKIKPKKRKEEKKSDMTKFIAGSGN